MINFARHRLYVLSFGLFCVLALLALTFNAEREEMSPDIRESSSINANKKRAVISPEGPKLSVDVFDYILTAYTDIHVYLYPYSDANHNFNNSRVSKEKLPVNKGNEAMAFLTFIIDHYDNLPDQMLFYHGHRVAWHQMDMIVILKHLDWNGIDGYGSIHNCQQKIADKLNEEEVRERCKGYNLKPTVFPEQRATYGCCATFTLSKQAVLYNPIYLYQQLRQWLINTELPDAISGRCLEWTWHHFLPGNSNRTEDCSKYGNLMIDRWKN